MKRLFWALAFAAALVVAFVAGRVSNTPRVDGIASAPSATGVDTGVGVPGPAANGTPRRPTAPATDNVRPSPDQASTATPRDAAAPSPASRDPRPLAPVGPQPLVQDDLPRLEKARTRMGADGGTTGDLLDLADAEEQDDGARQLEALLAQAIRRNGGAYTELRMAPPHCTRSLCILRAIGAGQTQNPRSDWQRLSITMMGEPWWRESFDDARSMVTSDSGDTVYITLFVRCEPGRCRLAKAGQS